MKIGSSSSYDASKFYKVLIQPFAFHSTLLRSHSNFRAICITSPRRSPSNPLTTTLEPHAGRPFALMFLEISRKKKSTPKPEETPETLQAVAVESQVEVVDAGALLAVGVQPADGADEP